MKKILIGYVSPKGSTKEVAERIALVLESKSYDTEVLPMSSVTSLEQYDGIILGAPIHGFNWHSEASKFVQVNSDVIHARPVAVFTTAMMANRGRVFFQKQDRKALEKIALITDAQSAAIFGGVAGKPLPALIKFLFGLNKDVPLDQRSWPEIETWAANLGMKLHLR